MLSCIACGGDWREKASLVFTTLAFCFYEYSPGNRKSLRCSKHLSMSLCTTWKNVLMFQSEHNSFAFVTVHNLIVCIEWSKRWRTWKYFIVWLHTRPSFHFSTVNDTLTGICSVRGNSLAIVPARSHEFVMVTRDCKSSDQKCPQVVPCISFHEIEVMNTVPVPFIIQVKSRVAYKMKFIFWISQFKEDLKLLLTLWSGGEKNSECWLNFWSGLPSARTRQFLNCLSHKQPITWIVRISPRLLSVDRMGSGASSDCVSNHSRKYFVHPTGRQARGAEFHHKTKCSSVPETCVHKNRDAFSINAMISLFVISPSNAVGQNFRHFAIMWAMKISSARINSINNSLSSLVSEMLRTKWSSMFLPFPSLVNLSKKSMTGSSTDEAITVAGLRAVEGTFNSFTVNGCTNSSDSLSSFVKAWNIMRLDVSDSLSSYCKSARQFANKHDIKLAQHDSVRYFVMSCKMLVISMRFELERTLGNVFETIKEPLDVFVYCVVRIKMLLKSEQRWKAASNIPLKSICLIVLDIINRSWKCRRLRLVRIKRAFRFKIIFHIDLSTFLSADDVPIL